MPDDKIGDDVFDEKKNGAENADEGSWDDIEDHGKEEKTTKPRSTNAGQPKSDETKKAPEFSELKRSKTVSDSKNIDFILDIPLEVTVELGRTYMPIYDLLQLGQGSIVELNKLAGEPLEILINQKLIAKGEVVVVNEKFGVRLTDVVSPKERVENLV
jgi:flagellar motor switch protein FliN